MLLSLAWRNIWRNRKRSAIIVTAIVIGLCSGVFCSGFMEGMIKGMVVSTIDRSIGDLQIHAPGFLDDKNITESIPDAPRVIAAARATQGVTAVSARALIAGMIASPTNAQGGLINAIVPDDERRATSIASQIVEGKYFDTTTTNAVVIGRRLAKKLEVKLRSKIILSFAGPDGNIVYLACRITGLYATESAPFDEANIFMRRSDLATALGADIVHEIILRTNISNDSVAFPLRAAFPALMIASWKEIAPEIGAYADLSNFMMALVLGVILIALLFGITNTMLMSVLERMREFAILLAVGMKRRRLFFLILIETILLSCTASAIGTAIGVALIVATGNSGINLSMFAESLSAYRISSYVYPTLDPSQYAMLAAMVAATALLAALYPGWKAVHLNPAEAIHTS